MSPAADGQPVYHLELRRFPKRVQRFNLTGAELGAIVLPWVQERVIELGEQRWSPHDATITVIEGPELSPERLALGRGWREAEREGSDVTERVLAEARSAVAQRPAAIAQPPTAIAQPPAADSLAAGVELAALLGPDPGALLASWRAVTSRASGLAPSEALALAERELNQTERRSGG